MNFYDNRFNEIDIIEYEVRYPIITTSLKKEDEMMFNNILKYVAMIEEEKGYRINKVVSISKKGTVINYKKKTVPLEDFDSIDDNFWNNL